MTDRELLEAAARAADGLQLADAIWCSDEVMSLNADLGLTIEQLTRLGYAIVRAAAAMAEQEQTR
jgi:hypothetical protein